MWLVLALCSALLLGVYDVWKKLALKENAVIPVLLTSVLFSSFLLSPFLVLSRVVPEWMVGTPFYVPEVGWNTHLFLILKAVIVLSSWLFAYFAMKHLPITLASPIKATQPVWVVLGGVFLWGEHLNGLQLSGVVITLCSFFLFSVVGKKEGFSLRNNQWIWFIILATLTGAASGLYDKYLIHEYDRMVVQVYYTFYQALIMLLITLFLWYPTRKKTTPFQFRWSILAISLFLILADFIYFYALAQPDSLISVVSTMRRSGVIVPFLYGAFVMHDKNIKLKMIDMFGILIGMLLLFLGS